MHLARSTALVTVLLGLSAQGTPARAAQVVQQDADTVTVHRRGPAVWMASPGQAVVLAGPQDGGYLGVQVADVDSAAVSRLKLPALRGARVVSVEDSSPAAKAGLQDDDVIVSLDGQPVRSVAELTRMVRETPAGRSVTLGVVRGGSSRQVTVVTGQRPGLGDMGDMGDMGAMMAPDVHVRMRKLMDDSTRARIREEMDRAREEMRRSGDVWRRSWRSEQARPHAFLFELGGPGRMGVRLQPISDQLGTYFGVEDGHGALVSGVRSESAAEKAGLKAGDVIVEVAGKAVEDPADVVTAIQDADAGPVTVKVMRDRKSRTFTVDLPERPDPDSGDAASLAPGLPPAGPLPAAPAAMPLRAPLPAPALPPLPALRRVDRII